MRRRSASSSRLRLALLGSLGLALAMGWFSHGGALPVPHEIEAGSEQTDEPPHTRSAALPSRVPQRSSEKIARTIETRPATPRVVARFVGPEPATGQPEPGDHGPLRIQARVWTPSGKPVAGARVELLQTPLGVEVGPEASAVEAQYRAFRNHPAVPVREDAEITDPEGLATLEVPSVEGSLHLRAVHPDFDRAIRTLEIDPVSGGTYGLFLRDGATVEAWIYGELPSPGSEDSSDASARVVYLYQGPEGRPRARRQATIEEVESGRYRAILRGLPAGTWDGQVTVLVPIRGGRGWKTLARAPHPVTLSPGGQARMDFVVTDVKCSL